jgi:hypothetical protein
MPLATQLHPKVVVSSDEEGISKKNGDYMGLLFTLSFIEAIIDIKTLAVRNN